MKRFLKVVRRAFWIAFNFLFGRTTKNWWVIRVSFHQRGERLDTYLTRYFPKLTKGFMRVGIRKGDIRVNLKKVDTNYRVVKRNLIYIKRSFLDEVRFEKISGNLKILYEDDYLIAVDKPPNIPSHPSFNFKKPSIIGILYGLEKIKISRVLYNETNVVHRLDKPTSGVMLVAKREHLKFRLQKPFSERKVYKEYFALLYGHFPEEVLLVEGLKKIYKGRYQKSFIDADGVPSITYIKPVRYFKHSTLCKIIIPTGRMHQIRAMVAYRGFPIVGDYAYNGPAASRLFLHHRMIIYPHPFLKKNICIISEIPESFFKWDDEI